MDFVKAQADKINVAAIDGKTGTPGVNGFTQLILNGPFTAEGQIRAFQSGANTVVEFNTTGVSGAEMQLLLVNFNANTLALGDFIVAPGPAPFTSTGPGSGVAFSPAKQSPGMTLSSSVATVEPILSREEIALRVARDRILTPVARTTGAMSQKKSSPTGQTGALPSTGSSSAQLKALDSIFAEISSDLLALS